MPAIQPEQLQRQIEDLIGLAYDPRSFIRSTMNLLDYYADRTKRPRSSTAKIEIAKILRVPRPVMRTLCQRILQFDGGDAERWLEIGRGLWSQAIREARQVAACTLAKSPEELISNEVEAWAIVCEDDEALTHLTTMGLRAWRVKNQQRFYASVEAWLLDPRVRIRHLAILALHARSGDDDFDELPMVLEYLAGLSTHVRGSSQRSLTSLIRQLAQISAPEVAKYLINELEADVQGARRLAQAVLAIFPGRLQQELRESLG
jgi:hypothetical protein